MMCMMLLTKARDSLYTREPIRDSKLTGPERVSEVLNGHVDRCYEQYKMEHHVFLNLEALMRQRGWLEDSRYLRVDEQLAMFISIVGHNDRYRDIAEHFQRSLNTIGEHFKKVLRAFILLGQENIKPPNFSRCPKQILEKPKLYPFFKDCIGAIDGTHFSAFVPLSKQIPYRGRKGDTTWNVMCACDLDMKFTFVYASWEGSANDYRVFNEALNNPKFEFPHPPPGKYYAVDSGYPSTTGFLTPFKGQRYHLNDYRNRRPRTAVELFNNGHSFVRNVIERSFGSLKKRFPILSKMPCFPLNTQTCIVIACCALHNFIREEEIADKSFKEFGENWWNEEPEEIQYYVPPAHISISLAEKRRQMDDLRKKIANELAIKAGMAQIT
ncbi:protein ALP1-like [Macadamia integrifolia]|uniref:protein ALP1-like n=1 Tax=Macadamia integrifolia TaxID=60698 RepID=UPI001C4F2E1D|nr:protein ALP1-like [Macadamia integrifolia]